MQGLRLIMICALVWIALERSSLCERLPMRVYSTADGLAHHHVSRIRRDSRGFLWFCTDDGLSNWDGYEFKTYTMSDGLPHAHIDDLLETRRGEYWIATDGGLAHFQPERRSAPFTIYFPGSSSVSRAVNVLLEDTDGTILVGTAGGLYRLEERVSGVHIKAEEVGFPARERDGALVTSLLLTQAGDVWAGAGSGIYQRLRDGNWRRFSTSNGLPANFINELREDPEGHIWAGTRGGGLLQLAADVDTSRSIVARLFTNADGLPNNDVRDFLMLKNGHMWVGTRGGLAEAYLRSPSTTRFRTHSIVEGLADQSVYGFAEDTGGNLWLATAQAGAIRLSREGLHTYGDADGFQPQEANQIITTRDGHVCIINGDRSRRLLQCFDGERFSGTPVPPFDFGFEWHQFALQDHVGRWWFATERGAWRMSRSTGPVPIRTTEFISAFPITKGVWHVYEDSRGVIWLAEETADAAAVVTWNPATRATKVLWHGLSLSGVRRTAPSCFVEDGQGQVWVGLSGEGGLLRWSGDHVDAFGPTEGVPAGEITDLYADRSNRLWIASSEGGLGQMGDLNAAHPHIRTYSRMTGLSSNEIWCITEDQAGRIYAGTGRGVDALDPAADQVVHYTADDGLIPGPVRACVADPAGDLWFVTNRGVSRLTPAQALPQALPHVLIKGFRISGGENAVSQLGAEQVGPIELGSLHNQVAIDFLGMDSRLRGDLRYQYRLLGADTNWSKPAVERNVTFASLAPGQYRFEVRAIDAYGRVSSSATAEFAISPRLWQRWWLRLALAIGTAAVLYWLHHYRTLHLLELEKVRTRIATDLHDDIGSGLSQIAVLAEVARRRVNSGTPDLLAELRDIGSVSRELADSMSDIVWSVNPRRDHLSDLAQRMRRFSTDMLACGDVDFRFDAFTPERPIRIDADIRREIYLIFKEAVNNVARHSHCTRVGIAVAVDHHRLDLQIEDNGKGLCERSQETGNGIRSMTERARRIGAHIEISSGEEGGVRVVLQVPVRQTRSFL
jgi:ligand-binding sensor domain-containing protein/two-component sensor histidine kinase